MTPEERDNLARRFREVSDEIAAIARNRIVPEKFGVGEREAELLEELERIEFELGSDPDFEG